MCILRWLLIGIGLSWLVGCTTLSTSNNPPPQNQTQSWRERVQALSNIQTWNLKGLIAIRNNTQPDNISANLQWQQSHQNYQLLLFGPLGASAVTLKGSPGRVTLQTANGQIFNASSPETILAEQTHWRLPVSNLYYWIRGLPAPNLPAKKQFDTYHHLTELYQQGWRITYLSYISENQIDVPNKIMLTNSDFVVKIVIKQWSF